MCKTLHYNMVVTKKTSSVDVIIEKLIVERGREEHIAKHEVTLEEVIEIVSGDYAYIQGKLKRRLLIGKTKKGRFLTIIVGTRRQKNTYGLVTARPTRKEEKSFYKEFILEGGGEI